MIQTLPGVASVVSLLPFPVVRGASPSSTGFLLDGTRVPLLYHLLVGTSVIHPEFIDEIQFYPGGAPAPYGGYTGGIIDGRTARARPDEHLLDFDVNLLQVGGLVREPIKPIGATVTAAARYGYPGFLLGLATNQASLSYWDYQLRLDGGNARNGWTVFVFGANDELDTRRGRPPIRTTPNPPLDAVAGPRLPPRSTCATTSTTASSRRPRAWCCGYDHTLSDGHRLHGAGAPSPRCASRWRPTSKLDAATRASQGSLHKLDQGVGGDGGGRTRSRRITAQLDKFYVGSAYLEALWRPTPRLADPPRRARRHLRTTTPTTKSASIRA